jgi:polyisoprenoid-binding protein YceI
MVYRVYKMKRFTLFLLFLSICAVSLFSQQTVSLIPASSTMSIQGTSSLHDWEEKVDKFEVSLSVKTRDKDIISIDRANFTCKAKSISSENSTMTNKTLDALKAESYPDISFKLVSVDKLSSQGGNFSGTVSGDITLAGVTKRISISFSGNNANNKISLKGSKIVSLKDYNIIPPTAMLGTLKTGDQVTISFNLLFQGV